MNTQKSKVDFAAIHKMADAAGKAAALALTPNPMIVRSADGAKSWLVPDGVCGFSWIEFPGNTAWGRWTKKTGLSRAGYPKGLCMWVHDYNQSMQKKEAYARAYAAKLREKGIEAWAQSRMD